MSEDKGEILGMLGPNGVGKSTIFYLISGLLKPRNGEIFINGQDVTDLPIYERTTRYKIGYVPQYGGYFSNLTVIENLKSVAEIQIKDKDENLENLE